jgi:hypothetical protein
VGLQKVAVNWKLITAEGFQKLQSNEPISSSHCFAASLISASLNCGSKLRSSLRTQTLYWTLQRISGNKASQNNLRDFLLVTSVKVVLKEEEEEEE